MRCGENPRAGAVVPGCDGEGEHDDDCKRELEDYAFAVRSAEISEYFANIIVTFMSIAMRKIFLEVTLLVHEALLYMELA